MVLGRLRECIDAHVQQYGELTQAEHVALTLILEKKFPINEKVTTMYKAAKSLSKDIQKERYTVALSRFFIQVNKIRMNKIRRSQRDIL